MRAVLSPLGEDLLDIISPYRRGFFLSIREEASFKYIRGTGLEIGGLHYPLVVLPSVSVTYVDAKPIEELKEQFSDVTIKVVDYLVDNAETLYRIHNLSQDFVIANHVLEHCEDVIKTLQNWLRVLKPGGILYMAIPDKEQTFDSQRDSTSIKHIFEEYKGAFTSRHMHYRDWYQNSTLEQKSGAELELAVDTAMKTGPNIHWHCWNSFDMIHLFAWLNKILPFEIVEFIANGSEVIWIMRKV